MQSTMTDVIAHLRRDKYYSHIGCLLSNMRREETTHVPAMAVMFKDRGYVLLYNPNFIAKATFEEVLTVCVHEAHHVLMEHIPRQIDMSNIYLGDRSIKFRQITPFAVDMACNALVRKYDPNWSKLLGLHPVVPGVTPFEDMPDMKSYEWYAEELMNRQKPPRDGEKEANDGEASEGDGQPHDGEKEANDGEASEGEGAGSNSGQPKLNDEMSKPERVETIKKMLQENHKMLNDVLDKLNPDEKMSARQNLDNQTRELLRQVIKDVQGRGTVPGYFEELVSGVLQEKTVPWTKILRQQVLNTQRSKRVRSLARPARHKCGIPQLMPFPGCRRDKTYTVAFVVDTSGSMGTEELKMALSELQHLQKADDDIHIHVIEADTAVGKEYELKPRTSLTDYHRNMTGRGGTDFNAGIERAIKLRPDAVFYYTDGFAPAPTVYPSCPLFWIITPGGTAVGGAKGKVIRTRI